MANTERPPITELGLLGLMALLWGSSYYFAKIALVDLPPMTLAAYRVAIAAIFLLIVMRIVGDRLPRDGRTWRMLFIQACFNSILSWSILAWGQQHIDVALASVLNSTSPNLCVLDNTCFGSESATWAEPLGRMSWSRRRRLNRCREFGGRRRRQLNRVRGGACRRVPLRLRCGLWQADHGPLPFGDSNRDLALGDIGARADSGACRHALAVAAGRGGSLCRDYPGRVLHGCRSGAVFPSAAHAWLYGRGEPSLFARGHRRIARHTAAWRTAHLDNRRLRYAGHHGHRID